MVRKAHLEFSIKRLVKACIVVVAFACIFAFGWRVLELSTFAAQRDAGLRIIDSVQQQRPPDIANEPWGVAISWLRTAYLNVFSSVDNPTSLNIRRFNSHAESIAQNVDSIVAIESMWEALSRTGPYGQEYVSKFYPEFRVSYEASVDRSKEEEIERVEKSDGSGLFDE